jgi:MoaA/NifB/PqqE/SkfB family radical SAM enzyme
MNRLLARLKTFRALANLGSSFFARILGHAKIIGYEKGYPVYSLLFPGFGSPGQLNSLMHLFIHISNSRPMVQFATIGVTDICDCSCKNCFFVREKDRTRDVLTTSELCGVLHQLTAMGVFTLSFVGGEPLLQKDILQILRACDTNLTNLFIFTNGSRLEALARDLKKAGLNRLYVSLEYPDRQRHDAYTGYGGLYDRALRGARASIAAGMLTGFSWTIHPDAAAADVPAVLQVCRETGVHELYVCREYNNDFKYAAEPFDPAEDGFFQALQEANQRAENKFGIVYYHYLTSAFGVGGCGAGSNRIHISAYGDVTPCDVILKSFGNVREEPVFRIYNRMLKNHCLCGISETCRIDLTL